MNDSVCIVFLDELDIWGEDIKDLMNTPFLLILVRKAENVLTEAEDVINAVKEHGGIVKTLSYEKKYPSFNDPDFGNDLNKTIEQAINEAGRNKNKIRIILWARQKTYFSLLKTFFSDDYIGVSYCKNINDGFINRTNRKEHSEENNSNNEKDFFRNEENLQNKNQKNKETYDKSRMDQIGNAFASMPFSGAGLFETKNISEIEAYTIKKGEKNSPIINIAANFFGKSNSGNKDKKNDDIKQKKKTRSDSDEIDLDDIEKEFDNIEKDFDDGSRVPNNNKSSDKTTDKEDNDSDSDEYLEADCYDDPEGDFDTPDFDEDDIPFVDEYDGYSEGPDEYIPEDGYSNDNPWDEYAEPSEEEHDNYRNESSVSNTGTVKDDEEKLSDSNKHYSNDKLNEDETDMVENNDENNIKFNHESKKENKGSLADKVFNLFGSKSKKREKPEKSKKEDKKNQNIEHIKEDNRKEKNYKSVVETEEGVYVNTIEDAKAALSYYLITNFKRSVWIYIGAKMDNDDAFEMMMLLLKTTAPAEFNKSWKIISDISITLDEKNDEVYMKLRDMSIYYYSVVSVLYYPRKGKIIKDVGKENQ